MRNPIPDDFLTMGLGARLPAPLALLVDAKRAFDGDVVEADVLGGAMLEAETPAELRPGALEQVLREIDAIEAGSEGIAPARGAVSAARRLEEVLRLPEPVRDAAIEALSEGGWKFGGRGISILPLMRDQALRAELLRIEPGKGAPKHGHIGKEYTLVLQGAFEDDDGSYGPGTLCERGPSDVHRPRAGRGGVCYALAVYEGPLLLKDMLGVLQRLTRH